MSDADPTAVAAAAASQTLRDTAKWLVTGVAGAAVAVLAGSSLTAFGSLEIRSVRFGLALAGYAVSLLCLGAILFAAIAVLTRDISSISEIAKSADPRLVRLREELETKFASHFPQGLPTLAGYVDHAGAVAALAAPDADERALLGRARNDQGLFAAYSAFWIVRDQFASLVTRLKVGGCILAVSLSAFALAANPPKMPATVQSITLQAPPAQPAPVLVPSASSSSPSSPTIVIQPPPWTPPPLQNRTRGKTH